MRQSLRKSRFAAGWVILAFVGLVPASFAQPEPVSLQALVAPSTVIMKEGRAVTFAVHGFIEFKSLAELFPYIESQTQRWKGRTDLDDAVRLGLRSDLLRRGIESRVVSMADERPLETLITHTREELRQALAQVKEPTPPGYVEDFLAVQEKWKHSLNCWSAAPSIPARVLSNWYPIEEGIKLYGATYDSTGAFLAGGEVSPGRYGGRSPPSYSKSCRREIGRRGSSGWRMIRRFIYRTRMQWSSCGTIWRRRGCAGLRTNSLVKNFG